MKVVDIYLATLQLSKYPPLSTSTVLIRYIKRLLYSSYNQAMWHNFTITTEVGDKMKWVIL